MQINLKCNPEVGNFVEFRRKVQHSEVLSSSMVQLVSSLHFTGKVSVMILNGRVLKSGYQEGFFRHGE